MPSWTQEKQSDVGTIQILEPLVDAAFQVHGATFKSLFANAALALDCRRARGDIELLGPSDS